MMKKLFIPLSLLLLLTLAGCGNSTDEPLIDQIEEPDPDTEQPNTRPDSPSKEPDDEPSNEPSTAKRTVLAYIVADNNLSSLATTDIHEMVEGFKSVDDANNNLLIYVDNYSTPMLYRLTKDEKGDVAQDIIRTYTEQVSTDPNVMATVLQDAFGNYPAQSYGLVYWSHCDGWISYPLNSRTNTRWVGQDKGQGEDRMNIDELVSVLTETPHLDFIMFDACFMLSVEVAYELRDYTDYYIASPTEIPGPGAPYQTIVPMMFGENAAINLAEAYYKHYLANYNDGIHITNDNWTGGCSIGTIRTDALENLAEATRQLLPEATPTLSQLRSQVFNYDKRSTSNNNGYYDMYMLMQTLAADEAAWNTWQQAYDEALVDWNTTPMNYSSFAGMFSMEGTKGISHYIPSSTTSAAATAYRSMAWYEAAGLSQMGW